MLKTPTPEGLGHDSDSHKTAIEKPGIFLLRHLGWAKAMRVDNRAELKNNHRDLWWGSTQLGLPVTVYQTDYIAVAHKHSVRNQWQWIPIKHVWHWSKLNWEFTIV